MTDRTLGGLVVAALVAVGLTPAAPTSAEVTAFGAPAAPPAAASARFVVAISVDGLNPDAIRQLGPQRAPSFHRLINRGAGTLNARTAVEETKTLPNHTGMLTGRRIEGSAGHHITFNHDKGTDVHSEAGSYRASLFDVVHDRGGRTALYTMKDKFAMFDRSWGPELGARDTVGRNNGRDKLNRYVVGSAAQITDAVVRQVKLKPLRASFLHLSLTDQVGHKHGFMSEEYLEAVEDTDRYLDRVLDAVRSTRYLRRNVAVVLTADHGGEQGSWDHGDQTDPDNYTIPFFAFGAGVARGVDLYDLNPRRADPGTDQPGYDAAPPIRNTDVASLVTTLLGHPAVPGGQLPGTQPLRVR